MKGSFFKENFWSEDITSTAGYDCLLQHMNEGRKNCKEFEDFLKDRAIIEEKYGKDLVSLCKKKPCGQTEINTLKRALDVFKQRSLEFPRLHCVEIATLLYSGGDLAETEDALLCNNPRAEKLEPKPQVLGYDGEITPTLHYNAAEIDNIGQCHIQLAQTLRDEARKMEEFRERQKVERKKIEAAMDAMHKQRLAQYKKAMDCKKGYEQKCRDKEEAEQNVARCNKNSMNQKQQDKIYTKLAHSKVTAEDADKTYQQSISLLDKIREDWQKEHITACMFFENQDWERINYYRNAVWTHVNQLSQQCINDDVMCEKVRKALEGCSIEKDIEYFTENNKTGNKPPAPIPYENFYNNQKNSTPAIRRGVQQPPNTDLDEPAYASVGDYRMYQ